MLLIMDGYFFPSIIFIHLLVILSWYYNNNNCIISQIEYRFFKKTFLGTDKFYVPFIYRLQLYINFFIGTINFFILHLKCYNYH
jgi:hypothetical protein